MSDSIEKNNILSCNVCGNARCKPLIEKDGYQVFSCLDCGLAFTWPQPQFLAEQYNSSYFDLYRRRRQFRLRRADARLKYIERIKAPGKLLDVGCSLGYFIEAANARGWCASGVEISPYASEEARKMGFDVYTGTLQEACFEDAEFDCITMWDVIEHVPDPTEHMLEVRRILADGGLVVIGTPDIGHFRYKIKRSSWRHLKPSEHIYYFENSSIRRLLEKTGFRLVQPPVFGGRSFHGAASIALKSLLQRLIRLNDVMIVYGVKDAI